MVAPPLMRAGCVPRRSRTLSPLRVYHVLPDRDMSMYSVRFPSRRGAEGIAIRAPRRFFIDRRLRPAAPRIGSGAGSGPSVGKGLLRLLDDRGESAALVHRQVGHDLPVELDPGQLGAVDELRIGQALGADGSVDALDPQGAEVPLLHLAVAVGILPGLLDR